MINTSFIPSKYMVLPVIWINDAMVDDPENTTLAMLTLFQEFNPAAFGRNTPKEVEDILNDWNV